MNLTDISYYINDINVPAENMQGWDEDYGVISRYEPEAMECLLGYELNKIVQKAWDDSNLATPIALPTIYNNLINGAEFSFNYGGRTINTKWDGLRNDKKVSLLSYYIYYNERNQNEQFNSGAGQAQSLLESAEKVDIKSKLVNVWGKFIDIYGDVPNYVSEYRNLGSFTDLSGYDYFNILPSAYNFLLANRADYPKWVFKPFGRDIINIMGI